MNKKLFNWIANMVVQHITTLYADRSEEKNSAQYQLWRTTEMDPLIEQLPGREDDPDLNREAVRVLNLLSEIRNLKLPLEDAARAAVNEVAIYAYLGQNQQAITKATMVAGQLEFPGLYRSWALSIALHAVLREIAAVRMLQPGDEAGESWKNKLVNARVQEARRLMAAALQADGQNLMANHNSMKATIEIDGPNVVEMAVARLLALEEPTRDTPSIVLSWMVWLGEEIKTEQPMRDIIAAKNPALLAELDITYRQRARKAEKELKRRAEEADPVQDRKASRVKAWVGLATAIVLLILAGTARAGTVRESPTTEIQASSKFAVMAPATGQIRVWNWPWASESEDTAVGGSRAPRLRGLWPLPHPSYKFDGKPVQDPRDVFFGRAIGGSRWRGIRPAKDGTFAIASMAMDDRASFTAIGGS